MDDEAALPQLRRVLNRSKVVRRPIDRNQWAGDRQAQPTMLVGFARYSRDQSFATLGRNRAFFLVMAAGSIVGSFIGGQLLAIAPSVLLLPALAAILLVSAVKVWRHV